MNQDSTDYQVLPFPPERKLVADGGRLAARRHAVHGLLEVDVTRPRQILREQKARTGEALSFTAFVLACLGKAVEANKMVHACRDLRGRLVLFDEVCVNTAFAAGSEGRKAHLFHVIPAVNRRSAADLHAEIRAFQAGGGRSREVGFTDAFVRLPAFARDIFYWTILHSPRWQKKYFGTVSLTSVGMFGPGGGWAIPFLTHSLSVALGGIAQKPGAIAQNIELREYLNVTLSFDHDIVDGAPAAGFAGQFRQLLECGDGLE